MVVFVEATLHLPIMFLDDRGGVRNEVGYMAITLHDLQW